MPQLKPVDLEKATSAADLQKKMKADLKSSLGKKNVKFVAAKNVVIGGKTIHLFIPTDTPALFEAVLKTKYPKAYRAKGTCDVEKDKATGATRVAIKSSSGQMGAAVVGSLIPLAMAGDKSFQVTLPTEDRAKLNEQIESQPSLKETDKPEDGGVPEWAGEEYRRAKHLEEIQSKPSLKKTDGPKEGGVPEWAKDEYRREARKTLIASMTPDGKIGSVYFGEEGRIRTTHGAGPEKEGHSGHVTVQFNIDEAQARKAFDKANPKLVNSKKYWDYFDQWLVQKLKNVKPSSAPSWATLVDSPDMAHDLSTGKPPEDLKLFEIFKNINGKVEGWHPSRGTATKFDTDKQTVAVLEAAIQHIDSQGLTDPNERNVAFYNFVKSRLPKFVPYMRRPEEVK